MKLPIPITINDITGKEWEFYTLASFKKFLKTEYEFWLGAENSQKGILSSSHSYLDVAIKFQTIQEQIKAWGTITEIEEPTLKQLIVELDRNYLLSLKSTWIYHGHYFVTPWLESYKISLTTGEAFIQAILNKQVHSGSIPNVSSYEYFRGYLLGCESELKNEFNSDLKIAEGKSLDKAKEILSNAKDELATEISALQSDIKIWQAGEVVAVNKLKQTLTDDLRLRGATKYWNLRAKHYKARGQLWIGILATILIVSIGIFSSLLYAWITHYKTPLNLNTLEGFVLVATVISLVAFAVRLFSKLALSAFHLQSDAEERSEITYVYLALLKDSEIDKETRNIVFQSIFSRVETGLLSKESGPTLPASEFLKQIRSSSL